MTSADQPAPAVRSAPRRRRQRWLMLALEVALIVLVLAGLAVTLWLRHALQAALPPLDGRQTVAGLTAPVTVQRDAHGTPWLTANSLDDLLFAQGYVTAADRLFQMDLLRRHAAGDLAVILGPSLLPHDRLQRTLQLRAAADRSLAALPAAEQHQLQAYADGVNAYLDAHADQLPWEFHALDYTPARWQPRDSLLVATVMAEDLTTSFPEELHRERLTAALPPQLVADMYPVGSWRDRVPGHAAPDLATPQRTIEQVPLDNSQSRLELPGSAPQEVSAAALLATFGVLRSPQCSGCRPGSNDWVVAGSRTATGAPLLSNDMHLGLTVPNIWYQAGLRLASGGLNVAGFTLPGLPFVIVGRNAQVAWGFTNTGADVQDVVIEHLRGNGAAMEFERPDHSWALVQHHREVIAVRGDRSQTLDVLTTTHAVGTSSMATPILSSLYSGEHRALALEWTLYDPSTVGFPLLQVDSASDAAGVIAAFSTFGIPSQNLVVADAKHIAYHALGRVPVRGPAIQHPRVLPAAAGAASADTDAAEAQDESPDDSEPQPASKPRHETAAQQLADIPPPPPPINYTIGSPMAGVPVDALDTDQVWSGYIPYDQLPQSLDPASGVLATANARVTPDDYPWFFSDAWADPYRVERIYALLRQRTGLTPADMLRVQGDTHSDFDRFVAQRLAYALDHASPAARRGEERRLQQAANLLRDWDGSVEPGSAAAAIADSARTQLWPLLLTAQLRAHGTATDHEAAALARLYTWDEKTTALENLLLLQPARWLPARFGSWNDVLTEAVRRGIAKAPKDLTHWSYAQSRPFSIDHPLFGSDPIVGHLLAALLGHPAGTGRQPAPGDGTTVFATGSSFGPSERFTADLADPQHTFANLPTGESGDPASPFYLDQFQLWLHARTLPLPLQPTQPAHTLLLVPR